MSTSCFADRQPVFERAALAAQSRAQAVHPVHVADCPPLRLHEAPTPERESAAKRFEEAMITEKEELERELPVLETKRKRLKLVSALLETYPAPDMGIPISPPDLSPRSKRGPKFKTERRASVVQRRNNNGKPFLIAQVREPMGRRVYLGVCRSKEEGLAMCAAYMQDGTRPPKQQTGPKSGSKKTRFPNSFGPQPARKRTERPRQHASEPKKAVTPLPEPPKPTAGKIDRLELLRAAYRRTGGL